MDFALGLGNPDSIIAGFFPFAWMHLRQYHWACLKNNAHDWESKIDLNPEKGGRAGAHPRVRRLLALHKKLPALKVFRRETEKQMIMAVRK